MHQEILHERKLVYNHYLLPIEKLYLIFQNGQEHDLNKMARNVAHESSNQ